MAVVKPADDIAALRAQVMALNRANQSLREQLVAEQAMVRRWQMALDSTGDGLWDWNPITNTVFFSSQWKSMLGYEEHDISHHLDE